MNLRTPLAAKLLGSLALLVLAALSWLFVIGPQTAALSGVREKTTSAANQTRVLRTQLVRLNAQAGHLDDTRRTAQALAARFPPTADQPSLFQQVTGAAAAAGISPGKVTALTPTAPSLGDPESTSTPTTTPTTPTATTASGLARQTVTVTVEGSLLQTQQLVANLEQMPRAFLIDQVTVGAGSDTGGFDTTVTGTMFLMPPASDPGDLRPVSGP